MIPKDTAADDVTTSCESAAVFVKLVEKEKTRVAGVSNGFGGLSQDVISDYSAGLTIGLTEAEAQGHKDWEGQNFVENCQKYTDLNSNGSASALVLLDVDDEDNDEVEIESNESSPLSNFLTDSPVSHENIHDDHVENNLDNHNVVDIDFHSCLRASNSTEAIVSVELERTNDAGLWGKISQDDRGEWG
ncbi:hypothetical protein OUZ56_012159 [Daphnia magna]|uniref:Uncharacterized protein n=1 Tax=Daphnia magna TaxID=35525 RepID=A0ABQ9Z283_9CRUS|nr:hypothetical protein OUZ56_012159 [Daphnia magna]